MKNKNDGTEIEATTNNFFTEPLPLGPYYNKDILPHIDSYRLTLEDGNYI